MLGVLEKSAMLCSTAVFDAHAAISRTAHVVLALTPDDNPAAVYDVCSLRGRVGNVAEKYQTKMT